MHDPSTPDKPVISPALIALYDTYTHAPLPRRVFMKRLTAVTGSTAAAAAVLPLLENNYAQAAVVPPADSRLSVQRTQFVVNDQPVAGYLAQAANAPGKRPGVIVIHENRGLNPHIEDITRRLALAGFLAFAPDYLSVAGGTPTDEDKAREQIATLKPEQVSAISLGALAFLQTHAASTGKCACVGFCWGGGVANQLAVGAPTLTAAVVFYGMQPAVAEVSKIQAAVQLHYAEFDDRINAGASAYEAALKAAGKRYAQYRYAGVNHAFNNDTNAARYNAEAAALAWERTLAFLTDTLS